MSFLLHHIKAYQHYLSLVEAVFFRFLHVKLLFFLSFLCRTIQKKNHVQPLLRRGKLHLTHSRAEYLYILYVDLCIYIYIYKLYVFSSTWDNCLLSYIYLFSNLSVSVWTCIYFVFCIIIQYYIVSVSQTVPALPFETSFNRLLFPFDIFPLLCACSSFPSFLFLLLSLSFLPSFLPSFIFFQFFFIFQHYKIL